MKTFVGPRLRQLRREHGHTQAEMATRLGVSPAYINLMEHNQRSLSVRVLVGLLEVYGVDWQDLVQDKDDRVFEDLRAALKDPVFAGDTADLREIRNAVENAPMLTGHFLRLHQEYRTLLENVMKIGNERMPDEMLATSAETVVHDFFRNSSNYFPELEKQAEKISQRKDVTRDEAYTWLKARLQQHHGLEVEIRPVEEMQDTLRIYDGETGKIYLSEALDHVNRVFQLAHVMCLVEHDELLEKITSGLPSERRNVQARCKVELANYYAAALLMPYEAFLDMAETTNYDIDRLAARFAVSFEQVCHRLTTLQKEGRKGIPFFFLRIDKAGNVTKRFNATTFQVAEYGGSCPVWNLHTAFRTPGVIVPQFVELPDGERFFTLARTTERPTFSNETQDRRLVLALGCSIEHTDKVIYASPYARKDIGFSEIGINCHLCPREGCTQRAHQPMLVELNIDPTRRGSTRYDSTVGTVVDDNS